MRRLKGRLGEFKVNLGIRLLLNQRDYRLIKNLTLSVANGTTQIDQLIISPYGIFVVETKNMKGWIFGDPYQAHWTQIIYRRKERFQNPIRQNYRHIKAVQELLNLRPQQIFGVVVFVGDCAFKTSMPPEVVKGVSALSRFVKSRREPVVGEHELPGLVAKLLDQRLRPGWRTNRVHLRNVKRLVSRGTSDVNSCPRCGAGLVERINRRSGEKFFGCERYPKCRGTRTTKSNS
jgi:restriction system protein